jgi:SAM-dependent methyltransferase
MLETDNGWASSARAYIDFQDRGDVSRTVLLDPIMLRLCGDVRGARVLDVGCGEGRFCRMLAARGATPVGIDPTGEMVRTATLRGDQSYVRSTAERLPFADASFDLVVSYITLVDIAGYRDAIAEMARVLRPGGHVVAANLGFVSVANGWLKDAEGQRLHYPVDRYAEERPVMMEWLGIKIVNWHRPLSAYMDAYISAGLSLREFLEPVPEDESLRDDPDFENWFRVRLFTAISGRSP